MIGQNMSQEIIPFDSPRFGQIRVITDENGDPWFMAQDILSILGIQRNSMIGLDEDEKGVHTMNTPGGYQRISFVSEAGFYSLVLKSRKPEAKAFKRWVTHDVLPAIRRHGLYATEALAEAAINQPDVLIAALQGLKAERERREALEAERQVLQPKADYYDQAMSGEGLLTLTDAARELSQYDKRMTRTKLMASLRGYGLLTKHGRMPTKHAIERGYMKQVSGGTHLNAQGEIVLNDSYAKLTRKGIDWCRRNLCMPEPEPIPEPVQQVVPEPVQEPMEYFYEYDY